jgi:hypothetical protein
LAAFSLVATQLPIHRFTGCGTPMIFRDCGSGQLLDQMVAEDFDALW